MQIDSRPAILRSLRPAFRTPELDPGVPLDLPPVAGVPYKEVSLRSFAGLKNDFLHKDALTTVDGKFGTLTPANFAKLHAEFGGRSEVPYDPTRNYTALDFLPPGVQALVNRDLELPQPVLLPGTAQLEFAPFEEDKSVGLTLNCHSTAWNAMRAYQGAASLEIFYGEMIAMDGLVTNAPFTHLGSGKDSSALPLQPGDLVQFYDTGDFARYTMLLHSAVYVGGGLFFEKPNTEMDGEDSPPRLATWETMSAPVSSFCEGRFEVRAYRATQPLPPGETAFESSVESAVKAWAAELGEPLGLELCQEFEQSMGGGIRGEYVAGIVPVELGRNQLGHGGPGAGQVRAAGGVLARQRLAPWQRNARRDLTRSHRRPRQKTTLRVHLRNSRHSVLRSYAPARHAHPRVERTLARGSPGRHAGHDPDGSHAYAAGAARAQPRSSRSPQENGRDWRDPAGYRYPYARLARIRPPEAEPSIPELPCPRAEILGAHSSGKARTCTWETDRGDIIWNKVLQKCAPLHPDLLEAKPGHYINRRRLRRVRRDGNFFSLLLDNGRVFAKLHELKHYAVAEKLGLPHFFHLEPRIELMHTYRLQDYPQEIAAATAEQLRSWFSNPRDLIGNLLFQAVRYRHAGIATDYGADLRSFWLSQVCDTLLRAGFMTATEHKRWTRPNYQAGSKDTLWHLYMKMVAELVGEGRLFSAGDLGLT
jgi:hypothetical protein